MNKEFEVHMLNQPGRVKAVAIAEAFDECLNKILAICTTPVAVGIVYEGRELDIVRTKMEEACFFAKKAMAKQVENTVVRA